MPLVVLGITGGIATGKSTIAREFQALGATLIDADDVGREVVRPGEPALAELVAAFGPRALRDDGSLDRVFVGDCAFTEGTALQRLNRITHRRLEARLRERLAAWTDDPPEPPVVVLEAAVLFSAGWNRLATKSLLVTAQQITQVARLTAEHTLTDDEAWARIRSQLPPSPQRAAVDWEISGELTEAERKRQVQLIWNELLAGAGTNQ